MDINVSNIVVNISGSRILGPLSFCGHTNEIIAIVGKSGIGKTTLLKTISGLITPSNGEILLGCEKIESPSNKIGLVFQDYFVFPWLTVEENIQFGYKYGRTTNDTDTSRDYELLLQSARISNLRKRFPSSLSGGQLQRVAICRALAANPSVLLLDEPFGALDIITRIGLHRLISEIANSVRKSIIIVTHNISEAVSLADRVLLLSGAPAVIIREWVISNPRYNSNFYNLSSEHKSIVEEIIQSLSK